MAHIQSQLRTWLVLLALAVAPSAWAGMPSSGSCAFLMTLPVPYGATVTSLGETGYNMIGKITFLSATTGTFSGRIVNPVFQSDNSPYILAKNIIDLENFSVSIEAMTPGNGFTGGYKLTATGRLNGNSISLEWTGVPNTNGKSILMISSGAGTASDPKLGPGSGVCQF
jgi:hypothetical protein